MPNETESRRWSRTVKTDLRYYLAPNVYICIANGQFVMLDLQSDEYLGCDRNQTIALTRLLSGWPRNSEQKEAGLSLNLEAMHAATRDLVRKGLITSDQQRGKESKPPAVSDPSRFLIPEGAIPDSKANILDIANFFFACARAERMLRRRSLQESVDHVRIRKEKNKSREFDLNRATEKLAIFNSLRMFYPAAYLCLYDSLALLEFLARYHLFPTWVYGVQAEPFKAHCWIQEDDFALNESPEVIRVYTPIMAV